MKKVNVIDYNSKHANKEFRYEGTYLHGVLEREVGYDIFCFSKEQSFQLGATRVIIEKTGRMATFFLWRSLSGFRGFRGYLVYNNDIEYNFCRNQYEQQKDMI